MLESGGRAPRAEAQALSEAENLDPATHHAPEITVARRLGGASNLWGGRCLPFDPVDFAPRPWLSGPSGDLPAWPVGPAELEPWLGPACAWLAAGDPVFAEPLPGVAADPAFGFESLERWSNRPRIQELHGPALAAAPNLLVALGATVTGFEDADGGRIAAVGWRMSRGGAGGGSPRRASCSRPAATRAPGCCWRRRRGRPAASGRRPLGRSYMGHVNGTIADVVLENEALHAGLDFHVDGHGSYVRRRLVPSPETQAAERLTNVAFWPVVPEVGEPEPPLGAAVGGVPGAVGRAARAAAGRRADPAEARRAAAPRPAAHLGNVLRDLPRTARLRAAPSSGGTGWRSSGCRGSSCGTRPGATGSSTTPSSCRTRRAG